MCFREKNSAGRLYLQIVANERGDGRVRKRVIVASQHVPSGRSTGDGRVRKRAIVARRMDELAADDEGPRLHCRSIAGLCYSVDCGDDTGCRAVLEDLLAERALRCRSSAPFSPPFCKAPV